MPLERLHRFELNGTRFALDPETCFCFECDGISWDVLDYYPHTPINGILHALGGQYDPKELMEVVGELEWLRSTRSILKTPTQEENAKLYDIDRGFKRLTLCLPRSTRESSPKKRGWFPAERSPRPDRPLIESGAAAIALLLGRSGEQKDLRLELVAERRLEAPEAVASFAAEAIQAAGLSGKTLTVSVRVSEIVLAKAPAPLQGHTVEVSFEFQGVAPTRERLQVLAFDAPVSLDRLAKLMQPIKDGGLGRITVRPNHAGFGDAVRLLHETGFAAIELDLDGANAKHPELDRDAVHAALGQTAMYYAQCLLKQDYFRLDPIAALFMRIHEGQPVRRADPAGANELAVDETGAVYPSVGLLGVDGCCVGSLREGSLNEAKLKQFEDLGTLTTAPCLRCWARNLCGGGTAAVHQALSGSFRTPYEPWCAFQRSWMASAVAAFQLLSSHGVNFTRMYGSLTPVAKPSLFSMARAAFTLSIGVRPFEESDAEMLVKWENWSETAYFLCNEKGMLLATKYDREMDSLHPEGLDREMILIRKSGEPFGLIKIRPDRVSGAAQAWVYCRNEADYSADAVRKGVRFFLKEAGSQQGLRRVTIVAARHERPLQAFLLAVGFEKMGVQREALYLHGKYHDVDVYDAMLDRL